MVERHSHKVQDVSSTLTASTERKANGQEEV